MNIELILLFFLIATIYASAGFGGGSSYLAAMALVGLSMEVLRPTALLCNIVVVAGGSWIFWKKGYLDFKKIRYICLASIPMAYLGGLTPLKEKTFFLLLGASLVVSALLMIFQRTATIEEPETSTKFPTWLPPSLGAGVGYLSGVVGIGGGIFLSPLLHLLRWDTPKHIAATASFFILVNSVFGLAGQFQSGRFQLDPALVLPLLLAVLLGGQLGSRLNIGVFVQKHVRWVTAVLVLYAGINILWKNWL